MQVQNFVRPMIQNWKESRESKQHLLVLEVLLLTAILQHNERQCGAIETITYSG